MTDWKRVRFVGYISVHGDIVYEQTDLNPKVSLGRCRVVVRQRNISTGLRKSFTDRWPRDARAHVERLPGMPSEFDLGIS
jgi:hypothetical protein